MDTPSKTTGRYALINGLKMYYEIHGTGRSLVLIHGGGSTILSSFGRILPQLAKTHQIIAVELQAHGHTLDIDRPLSFEQDADDVAALLQKLHIENADIMGFSNGGTTALQIAIRHPRLAHKLVLASATYKRDGLQAGFFDGFRNATLKSMPKPLQDACLDANPDPKGLQAMFDRDVARMVAFKDISDAISSQYRLRRWSLTGMLKWCAPNTRLYYHAHCFMPGSQSFRAGMGSTSEKSNRRTSTVNCRIW